MSKLCFPAKILDQHLVMLGKTGAGKSSALRHIVEYLLAHDKRVCIIDPKGDWWGLKASADGKSAGFPIITFGDFKNPNASDVPLNPRSGKHVAELVNTGNRPCIVGFRGWMPGDLRTFWIDFASTLFNSPAGELYVVIDEVHNFAPKGKILDPKSGEMIHWTNRLLSEGRGLGLVFLVASQRPQKVHNDTLTCCETLVAMRVNHAADRKAVQEWIDGCGDKTHGQELLNNVAGMARGEAYVWSPEIGFGPERIKFPFFETFDSFAPPQLQKKVSQSGWSEVNLEDVKEKLATVIQEAKANDPAELKKRIQELQGELRRTQAAKPQAEVKERIIEVVDQKAVHRAVDSAIRALVAFTHNTFATAQRSCQALLDTKAEELLAGLPAGTNMPHVFASASVPRTEVRMVSQGREVGRVVNVSEPEAADELSGPQRKILRALAEFEAIGRETVSKSWIAARCEVSPHSGSYANNLGALRSRGLIEYPNPGSVKLTAAGYALAPTVDVPLNSQQMFDSCMRILSGPQGAILRVLYEAHPRSVSKAQIATLVSVSPDSGSFANNLGAIRSAGMIEYPQPGHARCEDWLFI